MSSVWPGLWDWRLWGESVATVEIQKSFSQSRKHISTQQNTELTLVLDSICTHHPSKAHHWVFVIVSQLRHYEPTKWVTTEQDSYFMEMALGTLFRRLFKYINGSNEAGAWATQSSHTILIYVYPTCSTLSWHDSFSNRCENRHDRSCDYHDAGKAEYVESDHLHHEFPAAVCPPECSSQTNWWQGNWCGIIIFNPLTHWKMWGMRGKLWDQVQCNGSNRLYLGLFTGSGSVDHNTIE